MEMTDTKTSPPEMTLEETLRVMDIARALRKERESVEREFSREEERALLQQRLLDTARITGEKITEAEIDVAIGQYYDRLHAFHPPPAGFSTFLAHVWVLRRTILTAGAMLFGFTLAAWWLFLSDSGPYSQAGRQKRNLAEARSMIERSETSIAGLTDDPAILADVEKLTREADAAASSEDASRLRDVAYRLEALDRRLQEVYQVRIVGNDGRRSAFEGVMTDDSGSRAAGYFVIVEARTENGTLLTRSIRDAESGTIQQVSLWAEQVPEAIYERLKADKQSDGILHETLFAVKKRGERDEDVVLLDKEGRPIPRGIQMTDWEN